MVDQFFKNTQQNNQGQQKSSGEKSSLNTENSGNKSSEILSQQRDKSQVQTSQQLAFNALFKTGTAQESTKTTTVNKGPSSLRSKSSQKTDKKHDHKPGHAESSSSTEEILEINAIRNANQRNTASAASNRGTSARTGTRFRNTVDGQDPGTEESLQHNLNSLNGIKDGIQSPIGSQDIQNNNQGNIQNSAGKELDSIKVNTSNETVKLLDLVGPEAILTFREKLQQVWVNLDEKSTNQLDVIARMPATLTGSSAMELLMIESPQGIHFVAFLKNKNDFEVLATFDRRALLPESPSRQLIEAGLIAFEQLDSVFKEGSQKIEQSAKEIANSRGTHDAVFMELQRLMVQEKRRRRKFKQMMDYFVDKLDELDLQGDPEEAPFVPNDLDKDQDGIGEGQLESEVNEELLAPLDEPLTYEPEQEDNDFH